MGDVLTEETINQELYARLRENSREALRQYNELSRQFDVVCGPVKEALIEASALLTDDIDRAHFLIAYEELRRVYSGSIHSENEQGALVRAASNYFLRTSLDLLFEKLLVSEAELPDQT